MRSISRAPTIARAAVSRVVDDRLSILLTGEESGRWSEAVVDIAAAMAAVVSTRYDASAWTAIVNRVSDSLQPELDRRTSALMPASQRVGALVTIRR